MRYTRSSITYYTPHLSKLMTKPHYLKILPIPLSLEENSLLYFAMYPKKSYIPLFAPVIKQAEIISN